MRIKTQNNIKVPPTWLAPLDMFSFELLQAKHLLLSQVSSKETSYWQNSNTIKPFIDDSTP